MRTALVVIGCGALGVLGLRDLVVGNVWVGTAGVFIALANAILFSQ